jgi:hypothetical protein
MDQQSLIHHIQLDTLSASTDIKFTISPAVDDFLAAFESFSNIVNKYNGHLLTASW